MEGPKNMQMRSETWGHVALATPATPEMNLAEEQQETLMLRCRYAKKPVFATSAPLSVHMVCTRHLVHNPGTLRDLAELFHMDIDQALFAIERLRVH